MKTLKNKFITIWDISLNSLRKMLLILLFLFSNFTLILSQKSEKIYMPKNTLEISTPYLPHAIVTNGEQGFSFAYSYPGFFSYLGQASLYYTNSLGDSYFGGIGETYLMIGINKKILTLEKDYIYLNTNIGTMFQKRYLGSFGFSYLRTITSKNKLELVLDLYFNHGISGDMLVGDKAYSKGTLAGFNYVHLITENFLINFGVGVSFVKYRYMRNVAGFVGSKYEYEYVSKRMEKYYTETGLYDLPKWDSRVIVPLGLTLSYHF